MYIQLTALTICFLAYKKEMDERRRVMREHCYVRECTRDGGYLLKSAGMSITVCYLHERRATEIIEHAGHECVKIMCVAKERIASMPENKPDEKGSG